MYNYPDQWIMNLLLTEVREYFKPDASKESLSGYSLVNKQSLTLMVFLQKGTHLPKTMLLFLSVKKRLDLKTQ